MCCGKYRALITFEALPYFSFSLKDHSHFSNDYLCCAKASQKQIFFLSKFKSVRFYVHLIGSLSARKAQELQRQVAFVLTNPDFLIRNKQIARLNFLFLTKNVNIDLTFKFDSNLLNEIAQLRIRSRKAHGCGSNQKNICKFLWA